MGLINALLPAPKGLPTNITPSQGPLQSFGGRIMQNLPYGGGAIYDILNSIVHGFQGTLGEHGPAPGFVGRIGQYVNPGYDQGGKGWFSGSGGGGGSTFNDPTDPNNPANYKLGDPGTPSNTTSPLAAMGRDPGTLFNAARPAFGSTWQQFMNPGSAIGPLSGAISNPYTGQLTHQGNIQGMSPLQAALQSMLSRMQP